MMCMLKVSVHLLLFCLLTVFPGVGFTDYFMRVSLLGTGTPRMEPDKFGQAILVEAGGSFLLFDAGRGLVLRLAQLDIPITEINPVFLTHLHSDHIFALDDLWLTGWVYQRPKPLSVHGPTGTRAFVEGLQQAFAYDVALRNQHSGLDSKAAHLVATEIQPGVVYSENGVMVTAFSVNHGPVDPAYGYRVDFGDRSVVISGDTTYSENLVEHAQGVDLLVHEIFAAHPDFLENNPRLRKVESYHTNPEQMLRVLHETKPKLAILTHAILVGTKEEVLIQYLQDEFPGKVHMGKDLMSLDVGSDVKISQFDRMFH